jgi:hypothetical protein
MAAFSTVKAETQASAIMFSHPALEHNILERNRGRMLQAVAPIMPMSDEALIRLVPRQTPLIKNACPSCRHGKPYDKIWDNSQARMMDFNWDPSNPDQIQCKTCETVYPNKDFPMDHREVFYNMAGEPVEIFSYYDPDKTVYGFPGQTHGRTGRKYYLDGVIDFAKWNWLFPRLEALAQLYHLTGDEQYARPAVLILQHYAHHFQSYLLTTDYGHTYTTTLGRKMPYAWEDTRWGRRMPDESMDRLLAVVDLVYASEAMEELSTRLNSDIRENVWQVFESGLNRRLHMSYGNFFGQSAGAKGFLPLAKVFGKIDLVHLVFQTYFDLPRFAFASDGSFFEGTGYAAIQNLYTARLREEDGYSDPVNYTGPDRLDNVYPFASREAFYRKAYAFLTNMRYPDGNKVVIKDASPFFSIFQSKHPRESSINIMKPGYKHLIMGDGVGDDQLQVHLGFGENSANHSRQDTLGLQMYAFAHPLIDVFPYHKSILRRYSEMTISHNTVVVDHTNQNAYYSDADPLLYVSHQPGLSVFSADGARVYRDLTSKYQRTLVLNTVNIKHPYLIDIFQVAGGRIHDYMLQSSTQFPQSAHTNLPMRKMEGLRPLLPEGETWTTPVVQRGSVGSGYGLLLNVKQAAAEAYSYVDFICDNSWDVQQLEGSVGRDGGIQPHTMRWIPHRFDPASWPENADVGMRSHILGQAGQVLFLAEVPALNREGFYGNNEIPPEEWQRMPHLVLRSEQADESGESLFVVIHEPTYGAAVIEAVRQVAVDDPDVLMLEISFKDGREDRFVFSLDMSPKAVQQHGLEFSGVMGLVAVGADGKSDAYLVGGTQLKTADGKADLHAGLAHYEGRVLGSARIWDADQQANSFTVQSDLELPEGDALAGQWIILKHHGSWDVYRSRNDIKHFRNDQQSRIWGLDDYRIWEAFYADIENPAPVGQMQGGGHCFQIASIEKRDGQTIIHVTDDHGLIISEDAAEEYFYPMRRYEGKTTFTIHSAVATQTTPVVSPAGGVFLGSTLVRCSIPGDAPTKLMVAQTAPSVMPEASDWVEYDRPLLLTEDTDLHVKSSAEDALRAAQVFTYSFSAAMKPQNSPGELTPGLIRATHYTDSSLQEGGLPNSIELGDVISVDNLLEKGGRNGPGKIVFTGMLQIDQPGIYTLYYLADHDGSFRLNGKELLERQPFFLSYPLARQVDVALEKGFYPIEFDLYLNGHFNRWAPALKLEWSGPGFERSAVSLDQLWYSKEVAARSKSALDKPPSPVASRPQAGPTRTRPTVYRGTIQSLDRAQKTLDLKLRDSDEIVRLSWDEATEIELRGQLRSLEGLSGSGLDAQLEGLGSEQLKAAGEGAVVSDVKRVTIFQSNGELEPGIFEQYSRICGVFAAGVKAPYHAVLEVEGKQVPFVLSVSGVRIYRMFKGDTTSFTEGLNVQGWAQDAGAMPAHLSKIILDTNP